MASLVTSSENIYYVGVNPPTGDYNDMVNKPAVDGVELNSSTTKADLGLDTVYNYKGQVATYDDLPSSGNHVGDVWNVADTGENYAWNEDDEWDCLTGADAVYFRNGKLESAGVAISIDADENSISNIETEDLKSGVLQTTVRAIASASDTALASEKAIRTELNTKQDTIDSNNKLSSDLVDDTNAINLFVTSTEKSTWTGKQDAINDLETIRSGAAAGATALQSGDLKTVNGQSVVGSGDIVITTNYSFDNSWTTDSTISDFLDDVYADVKAIPGMTYIGELTCSDLPTGTDGTRLHNAEAVVEVMPSATAAEKALHVVITSGNLDPYRWELTYWVIGNTPHNSGWIAFQPKLAQGTGITISNNTISANAMVGSNGTTAGSSGIVPAPTATDNTKFLKGDGTWASVDALPSQSGQSGKFLTTNGNTATWQMVATYDSETETISF